MNIEYVQRNLGFRLTVDSSLLDEIYSQARKHYPNEFGGILIGNYSTCGKVATITEICAPTKYSNSRVLFKRFVDNLNKRLSYLFKISNGETIYVGEWHSHPNGSSSYSSTDLNSISEIAKDSNVQISSPLMIIVSIYKDSIRETAYIHHNEKIYTYEKDN